MFSDVEYDPTDYVLAFRAHSTAQAEAFCQLLEDHEIPALVGEEAEDVLNVDELPAPREGIAICVPETFLEEAQEIVADMEDCEDFEDFEDDLDAEDEESEIDFDDGMSEATEESLGATGDDDDDDEMMAAVSADLDPLEALGLDLDDDDLDLDMDVDDDDAFEGEFDDED
jgi:hypothetical protein